MTQKIDFKEILHKTEGDINLLTSLCKSLATLIEYGDSSATPIFINIIKDIRAKAEHIVSAIDSEFAPTTEPEALVEPSKLSVAVEQPTAETKEAEQHSSVEPPVCEAKSEPENLFENSGRTFDVEPIAAEQRDVPPASNKNAVPKPIIEEIPRQTSIVDALYQDGSHVGNVIKQKTSDLKQALSIADRFRFQRELFAGNGERLSQAISEFNSMKTIEEAKTYMSETLKFDMKNTIVSDFIEFLKRKLD